MKKSKWSEDTACEMLARNYVSAYNKVITGWKNKGIRVHGVIDYLVNQKNYVLGEK
jgi:hypothetical protein